MTLTQISILIVLAIPTFIGFILHGNSESEETIV